MTPASRHGRRARGHYEAYEQGQWEEDTMAPHGDAIYSSTGARIASGVRNRPREWKEDSVHDTKEMIVTNDQNEEVSVYESMKGLDEAGKQLLRDELNEVEMEITALQGMRSTAQGMADLMANYLYEEKGVTVSRAQVPARVKMLIKLEQVVEAHRNAVSRALAIQDIADMWKIKQVEEIEEVDTPGPTRPGDILSESGSSRRGSTTTLDRRRGSLVSDTSESEGAASRRGSTETLDAPSLKSNSETNTKDTLGRPISIAEAKARAIKMEKAASRGKEAAKKDMEHVAAVLAKVVAKRRGSTINTLAEDSTQASSHIEAWIDSAYKTHTVDSWEDSKGTKHFWYNKNSNF